jgi:phosphoglycolate phosphatase
MAALGLPAPRAVIFDWDNTLVDTWPIIHGALVKTFREMGQREWTMDETMLRVRKSMRDAFPEVFGENWQKAGELYQTHYRSMHLAMLKALPKAETVLQRVRELNLYCTVVSNKKGNNLRLEIDALKWGDYFDSIVGSDDAARDKPHAEPVLLAFDKSGLAPGANVWFVGDSEIDLECAEKTGCTAILYGEVAKTHAGYSATHYQGFPYHAHAQDHDDMLKMLAEVEKALSA